ncbi:MAG: nitroreductase family protein [Armatimonadetes bacterium]|nr:nitroreductase family protein [Armatimonadota bacterium]
MDVVNAVEYAIGTRVSVRAYKDEEVPEDVILKVLEAGRRAPSGENAQPWRFIVVKDPVMRTRLSEIARRGSGRRFTGEFVTGVMDKRFKGLNDEEKKKRIYKNLTTGSVSAFIAYAPVLIVVIGHKNVWDTPFDCSAAIQNMLIMTHSLSFGACWVNAGTLDIRDELKIKELLKVPEEFKVISIVSLGRPKENRQPRIRLPLEEMVFKEEYGKKYF